MEKLLVLALVVANSAFTSGGRAGRPNVVEADSLRFEVEVDREDAVYKVGAPVTFQIGVFRDGQPAGGVKFQYELTGDGGLSKSGAIVSATDRTRLQAKLDRPGFILLVLKKERAPGTYRNPRDKYITIHAGAAAEPERVKASRPVPADFDEFWQRQLAYLRSITYTVKTAPVQVTGRFEGKVALQNVWLNGKGGKLNVNGQLAAPIGARPGSHPAIATFNGASRVGAIADQSQAVNYKALVFNMNLHDLPPSIARKDYGKYRRKVRSYQYKNSAAPDRYAMRDIFLRVVRAVAYLKTRPEWDRKTLVVRGGSLGGCQAIVAAALDRDVTLCAANAAAMCDHTGCLAGQSSGWPQLLRRCPNAMKTAPYFDAANFATRITCPTYMTVGFVDVTCPPTATYAAYNNIPGESKKMHHSIGGGHGGSSLRKGEAGVYGFTGAHVARHIRR